MMTDDEAHYSIRFFIDLIMRYTIIDSKELAALFEEARIQLQQSCLDRGQKTDISSMQENAAFLQVIVTYLTEHPHLLKNKESLIDELVHCLKTEISGDYLFSESEYKTILGILLNGCSQ